ncbi:MAG TPA: pilus assembly protein TadG-related protein, partial [Candidatus Sulfomarinibacteraceae bacterium]|nr:pilus assembly protein TadG-related protein [Candidatus Sulfomarinibacteraceae bacterium]
MERYYRRLVAAPESGQTAILFMLMIIGLVAFVGLAVDGGHTLNERRITQNAADASALSGIHYIASSDAPAEEQLLKVINQVVESNGVPDTDNTPGNEINDNVTVYYTDNRGNRMDTQPCYIVGDCPLGPVPSWAFGVEVNLKNQVETYFIGVIGQNELEIGADAVAVVRGGNTGGDLSDYSMVAFGQCDVGDKPFDVSTNNADFIGGVYSSSWF